VAREQRSGMMLHTSMDAIQILPIFQDFEAMVGASRWERMVALLDADLRGRPYLTHLYHLDNRMTYALAHMHREYRNGRHVRPSESPALYEAATLVVQFVAIAMAHPRAANHLIRRLHGAIDRPEHMRAIQFELEVATQLARRGHRLTFPELENIGTFDILADVGVGDPIEFECKYVTRDKGRPISRLSATLIQHALHEAASDHAKSTTEGTLLRIILRERGPTNEVEIARLVDPVQEALYQPGTHDHPFGQVTSQRFALDESPFAIHWPTVSQIETFLESFGITNVDHGTRAFAGQGVIVVTIESQRSSDVLDAVFRTVKGAAKSQLTGQRPSALCVKFEGLSPEALIDIGREIDGQPSALRIRTSKFLDSESSGRVSQLTFFADAQTLTNNGSVTGRQSASYSFQNRDNRFFDSPGLSGLFRD
jgi:hypothetical protein